MTGEVSTLEVVENTLATIEDSDPELRAFISLANPRELRASARRIDAERVRGAETRPFAGIPIAVKDNIAVEGWRLTCGSRMLEQYVAPYDSSVVKRVKDAGLLIVGKTNMDEYGFGSSTENSAFFPTQNPRARGCVPGGSSGGSAAAVAGGLVPWALGTDTGGSIRQPASLCGVVGLRPTYGRVSRYGLVAFASSMDQIGPIATNVADASDLLSLIMGHDDRDSTSLPEVAELDANRVTSEVRIGIPDQYLGPACQPEVAAAVEAVARAGEELGWTVRSVSLPLTEYALHIYYLIASVEAASNLSKFDSVKYGCRSKGADTYEELVSLSRAEFFGDEVKRRIMLGTYAASAGYQDQYYNRACMAREKVVREFADVFDRVDILLSPASPSTAWPLGEKVGDPLRMYLSDILTVPAALAGIPALTMPANVDAEDRPIGVQLTAAYGQDAELLSVAASLERKIAAHPSHIR